MRAANACVGRQSRQFAERCEHLRRRAFKQAPATTAKKSVATKQHGFTAHVCAVKRNMAGGVAGDIDHLPLQTQRMHLVSLLQALQRFGHVFARGTEDRRAGALAQKVDATGVVGMVVGD